MELKQILLLRQSGVDIEGALHRFSGDSGLYEKFLQKFLSDPTFGELTKALKDGNAQDAMNMAHTLKGVSSNLGFVKLFTISSEMASAIRRDDFEGAKERYPQLSATYNEIREILSGA